MIINEYMRIKAYRFGHKPEWLNHSFYNWQIYFTKIMKSDSDSFKQLKKENINLWIKRPRI